MKTPDTPPVPEAACAGLTSEVHSLHVRSKDRDTTYAAGMGIHPHYCVNCGVHLPEVRPLTAIELQLFISALWWKWSASGAPPEMISSFLCSTAEENCISITPEDEATIKAHMCNRLACPRFHLTYAQATELVNRPPVRLAP